jgi:threonine/homoserine/homoserine lactone efflux protein
VAAEKFSLLAPFEGASLLGVELSLVMAFAVAALLLSLAPGPDMLFVVANALGGGRRSGVLAALGMSAGLAVHTTAAALGLGALLQAAPSVLDAVRLGGALFLAYLAIGAWRRGRQAVAEGTPPMRQSARRVFVMTLLTNLANPKVVLFYLAFLPQFLTRGPGAWTPTSQLLVLGAIFIVIGLAIDASAGVLAGALSERVFGRVAVRRWLERVSAAVFGGLAVRLMVDAR